MHLSINNFRGISSFETEIPGKIFALTGPSGSGKSSILKAIRFLFTGEMNDSLIRKGETSAKIQIIFDNGDVLSRTREPGKTKCRINGKAATLKAVDEFLVKETGVPASAYEAVMGCDMIEQMNAKDMSSFLMNILPLSSDISTILDYCRKSDNGIDQQTENVIRESLPENNIGFSAIINAYNALFDKRTVQNRFVNELKARTAKLPPALPEESMEQLDAVLFNLAEAEANKKQETSALKAYEEALKIYEAATARADELKKEVVQYKDIKMPDKDAFVKNTQERQQFLDAVSKIQSSLAAINGNIELTRKMLSTLDQPVCPLNSKLKCTTDKRPLRKELEESLKTNEQAKVSNEDFLSKCKAQIAMRDKDIEAYHKDELLYSKKCNMEKQLKELTIPAKPIRPETSAKTYDIEAVKRDVAAKKKAIMENEQYKKDLAEYDKAKALADVYDRAVKLLDAKQGFQLRSWRVLLLSLKKLAIKKQKRSKVI